MTKLCGELKALAPPTGGSLHVHTTEYSDGTSRSSFYRRRMVFPLIQIGDTMLEKLFVANDRLGSEVAGTFQPGERVCMYYFGHLLTKKCIIGMRSESGHEAVLENKGYFGAFLWYGVFSPFIVGIAGAIVGMLVGMIGGQKGTAMGLLFGFLYGVGISWYSGYRFSRAWKEMKAG
jgi:hypothetical protein